MNNSDTCPSEKRQLQLTGLEMAFARQGIKERGERDEARRNLKRLAENLTPVKSGKGRGRPNLDTTKLGVDLLKRGETPEQMLPKVCFLYPGYSQMSQEKQSQVQDRMRKTILEAYRKQSPRRKKADNSKRRKP